MQFIENLILGAGVSGIAAAYELNENNYSSLILESNDNWGGLLDNFIIDGFRFDKFVHLSFTTNEIVNSIFSKTQFIEHEPKSYNFYKGHWLKHPAQNNLFALSENEKQRIVNDFISRKDISVDEIKNYEEWLRVQYGDYFAENFPMVYTKKYWTTDAKNLETKWIGSRMYMPSLEEIQKGCNTDRTPNTYYAKSMRYPEKGGYKSFLTPLVNNISIKTKSRVTKIDIKKKQVEVNGNETYSYQNLISSIPLPEICKLIRDIPERIYESSEKLNYTSGYLISLGFNNSNIADKLWYYIYDRDILPARVYSPSLKSPDNVPSGCSSIQAELYYNKGQKLKLSNDELLEQTIAKFIRIGLFKQEDLIIKDIRSEKYANVVFDHHIYENRQNILDYLSENNIISVGRFGEWEYFWSDQSLLSGLNGARKIINKI